MLDPEYRSQSDVDICHHKIVDTDDSQWHWQATEDISLAFLVCKTWIPEIFVLRCLALQGAFVEHRSALERLPYHTQLEIVLVKTIEDLNRCDALIIPGGGKWVASVT